MANFYVASSGGHNSPYNNWGNASTSLKVALASAAAGDTVYVASNHIDLTADEVSLASNGASTNPVQVTSVELGGSTSLVHVDNDDQGGKARGVAVGSSFVFLANDGNGLQTYTVGSTGKLTFIDADAQGGSYRGVAVGSSFVVAANSSRGIMTYSVGSTGALTFIDSDNNSSAGGHFIHIGSSFAFVAKAAAGVSSYSIGSTGALTFKDSNDQGGFVFGVHGDENFLYTANSAGGLFSYSVSSDGVMTVIDNMPTGGGYINLIKGSSFLYGANANLGISSISVGSTGALTLIDTDDQGGYARHVWVDNDYVYLANSTGGVLIYSVNGAGALTFIDSDARPSSTAFGVVANEKFILVANGVGGIDTYSKLHKANAGGNGEAGTTSLIYIDKDDQGSEYNGVYAGSSFVFAANDANGLHSYSVGSTGALTLVDTDDQGGEYEGVTGGSSFIFVACGSQGLRTYSVGSTGALTYIDTDDQGGYANMARVGSSFIFLANGPNGVSSYSVGSTGALTFIDAYNTPGDAWDVSVGSSFIFVADKDSGIVSLSVGSTGALTYIDTDDQGGSARGVYAGSSFVFLANNDQGLLTYSVGSTGALTYIDTDDQGGLAIKVTKDGDYIYLANNFSGVSVFTVGSTGALTHQDTDDQGGVAKSVSVGSSFMFLGNSSDGLLSYNKFSDGAAASTAPQYYETMVDGGGRIGTSGANNLILDADTIYTGMYFDASDNLWHNGSGTVILRDCKLDVDDNCTFGGANSDQISIWENVNYNQVTAGNISIDKGQLFWREGKFTGASNLVNGNLFTADSRGGDVVCEDLDLIDMDSGDYFLGGTEYNSNIFLKRCKLQSGSEPSLYNGTISKGNVIIKTHSCSGSDIIYQLKEQNIYGVVETDVDVYANATYDGTNGYSYKITPSPKTTVWSRPLRFKLAEVYSTKANPTLAVELVTDNVGLNSDQFWLEIEHPRSDISAYGKVDRSSRSSDIITSPSTLAVSSIAWTDGAGITEKKMKVSVSTTGGQVGIHTIWACVAGTTVPVYVDPQITKSF